MPPGAKGEAEGLGPSCSEIHNSQEHAIAKLTPPLTFTQQCYRHLKVSCHNLQSAYSFDKSKEDYDIMLYKIIFLLFHIHWVQQIDIMAAYELCIYYLI